ncbi:MAG: hypothetical protein ABIA97_03855 [Candidatus Omnitrophota bacterium]
MMRLLNKKHYGAVAVFVCIVLNWFFISESLGGQDPPKKISVPKLATESIVEEQVVEQEESQSAEDITQLLEIKIPGLTTEGIVEAPEVVLEESQSAKVITRLFEINNADVNKAKEEIEPLLTKGKDIESSIETFAIQRSGKKLDYLVVKDTPENVEQIELVIERLEKEFAPILIDADFEDVELGKVLTTLARASDLNIIGGEGLAQKVSIHLKNVALNDLFDILLRSSGYTYLKENDVVWVVPEEETLTTEVFELQYISAPKIEQAAAHLISDKGQIKSFSKFQGNDYSHFLIVTDTTQVIKGIRQLVEKLDKKRQQVVIEAKFAEVQLTKDNEWGIDWVLEASLTGASGPTLFPIGRDGAGLIEQPQDLDRTSGSLTSGTISYSNFSTTLKLLDSKAETNLIASPSIATRDGEEATIVIGDKIPIPTYERNEETGSLEITGYEEINIGVLLKVTPIINSDNTVTLDVHPEVSEIIGYTGPNNERPIIATREVTTSFTVGNGKTIVLGGLTRDTLSNTTRKVPILGYIPILGEAFTFHDNSDIRRELLIFITPRILDESKSVSLAEK